MASDKNNPNSSSSIDGIVIQSLMSRLQLRPPYLDTNSFLSHSLDDFLLPEDDDKENGDDISSSSCGEEIGQGRLLAEEEAKLEKEIIRIVLSGDAQVSLNPNSGQSVDVGGHDVCVRFHDEPGYRVWEWHGHVMVFDEESGYSAEYIYGNYFERLRDMKKGGKGYDDDEEEEKSGGSLGLRELIGDSIGPVGGGGGRVLHWSSVNAGSAAR